MGEAEAGAPQDEDSLAVTLYGGTGRFFEVLHWIVLTAAARYLAVKVHSVPITVLAYIANILIFLGVLGIALERAERWFPQQKLAGENAKGMAYLFLSCAVALGITLFVWTLIFPTVDALALEAPR